MSVLKITSNNFNEEVINSGETTIVDFYADWCGPCKMMSPVIDSIAEEVSSIKVGKLNVDEAQDIAASYNVMSIPTIIFVGVTNKENILNSLN